MEFGLAKKYKKYIKLLLTKETVLVQTINSILSYSQTSHNRRSLGEKNPEAFLIQKEDPEQHSVRVLGNNTHLHTFIDYKYAPTQKKKSNPPTAPTTEEKVLK